MNVVVPACRSSKPVLPVLKLTVFVAGPNEPATEARKVPVLITIPPVSVFVPDSNRMPLPVLVMPAAPEALVIGTVIDRLG